MRCTRVRRRTTTPRPCRSVRRKRSGSCDRDLLRPCSYKGWAGRSSCNHRRWTLRRTSRPGSSPTTSSVRRTTGMPRTRGRHSGRACSSSCPKCCRGRSRRCRARCSSRRGSWPDIACAILAIELTAAVGAQHVDLTAGDVMVGEQRRLRAVRRNPLTVIERQAGLHRRLAERRTVVGRRRYVHRCKVQTRDVHVVVARTVLRARYCEVDVTPGKAVARCCNRVRPAAVLERARRRAAATSRSHLSPQQAAAAEAELGTCEQVVRGVRRG